MNYLMATAKEDTILPVVDGTSIATWDALLRLGFLQTDDFFGSPAVIFDFGNFKLKATRITNLYLKEVVSFNGLVSTARTITSIEFEMPLQVDSKEQCAAWIAWHLNKSLLSREKLIQHSEAELLIIGLQNQGTLPWVQEKEAYRVRPQCSVERGWLRQALKAIKVNVSDAAPDSKITISFDGRVLSFLGRNWITPIPALGESWGEEYEIAVSDFYFPARLMQETIHISIWKQCLTLGNRLYRGVTIAGSAPITNNANDSMEN